VDSNGGGDGAEGVFDRTGSSEFILFKWKISIKKT
jgi:hypothetical protein